MDGVSLLCYAQPDDWLLDSNFGFTGKFDTAFGVVSEKKYTAEYKGLFLSVVRGRKSTYCNLRGSLPMFYRDGKTNAYDYTRETFLVTLSKLKTELKTENAKLKTIESTVDIICPITMQNFIAAVKSYKGVAFTHYIENGSQTGIVFETQRYHFKMYYKDPVSKLLRLEIAVKKMIWIEDTKIEFLSDLKAVTAWEMLLKKVILAWDDVVFIDKDNYDYRAMKVNEQKKFLRLLDASHWLKLDPKQQSKAKKFLTILNKKYLKTPCTKEVITQLMFDKCQKLIAVNQKKGEQLTIFSNLQNIIERGKNIPPQENINQGSFNYLDKGLNHTPKRSQEKVTIKPLESNRRCKRRDCRKSLNGKKVTAFFCSCGCKDKYYQSQKQVKKRAERAKEKKVLAKIMNAKEVSGNLSITYTTGSKSRTDTIYSEDIAVFKSSVGNIQRISLEVGSKPKTVLTSIRARHLVQWLMSLNTIQKQTLRGCQIRKNTARENIKGLIPKQQPCAPQSAIAHKQLHKAQRTSISQKADGTKIQTEAAGRAAQLAALSGLA